MNAKHGCRKFGNPDDRIGHSTDDANDGGDGFEFIDLHVVTKNLQSAIEVLDSRSSKSLWQLQRKETHEWFSER